MDRKSQDTVHDDFEKPGNEPQADVEMSPL